MVFPREPRPGDRLDATWGRDIVRAMRRMQLSGGNGVRLTQGPNGSTIVFDGKGGASGANDADDYYPFCLMVREEVEDGDTVHYPTIRAGYGSVQKAGDAGTCENSSTTDDGVYYVASGWDSEGEQETSTLETLIAADNGEKKVCVFVYKGEVGGEEVLMFVAQTGDTDDWPEAIDEDDRIGSFYVGTFKRKNITITSGSTTTIVPQFSVSNQAVRSAALIYDSTGETESVGDFPFKLKISDDGSRVMCYSPQVYVDGVLNVMDNVELGPTGATGVSGFEWYEVTGTAGATGEYAINAYMNISQEYPHMLLTAEGTAPTGYEESYKMSVGSVELVTATGPSGETVTTLKAREQWIIGARYQNETLKPFDVKRVYDEEISGYRFIIYVPSGAVQLGNSTNCIQNRNTLYEQDGYWYEIDEDETGSDTEVYLNGQLYWFVDSSGLTTVPKYAFLVSNNKSKQPTLDATPEGYSLRSLDISYQLGSLACIDNDDYRFWNAMDGGINVSSAFQTCYNLAEQGSGGGGTTVVVTDERTRKSEPGVVGFVGSYATGVNFVAKDGIGADLVMVDGSNNVLDYIGGNIEATGPSGLQYNVNSTNFDDYFATGLEPTGEPQRTETMDLVGDSDFASRADHKHFANDILATGPSGEYISVFSNSEEFKKLLGGMGMTGGIQGPTAASPDDRFIFEQDINEADGSRFLKDSVTGCADGQTVEEGEEKSYKLCLDTHQHPLNVVTLATGEAASDYVKQDGSEALLGENAAYARVDHVHQDLFPMRLKLTGQGVKLFYAPTDAVQLLSNAPKTRVVQVSNKNSAESQGSKWYFVDSGGSDVYLLGTLYHYSDDSGIKDNKDYFDFKVSTNTDASNYPTASAISGYALTVRFIKILIGSFDSDGVSEQLVKSTIDIDADSLYSLDPALDKTGVVYNTRGVITYKAISTATGSVAAGDHTHGSISTNGKIIAVEGEISPANSIVVTDADRNITVNTSLSQSKLSAISDATTVIAATGSVSGYAKVIELKSDSSNVGVKLDASTQTVTLGNSTTASTVGNNDGGLEIIGATTVDIKATSSTLTLEASANNAVLKNAPTVGSTEITSKAIPTCGWVASNFASATGLSVSSWMKTTESGTISTTDEVPITIPSSTGVLYGDGSSVSTKGIGSNSGQVAAGDHSHDLSDGKLTGFGSAASCDASDFAPSSTVSFPGFGGTGSATTASRSDHNHDSTYLKISDRGSSGTNGVQAYSANLTALAGNLTNDGKVPLGSIDGSDLSSHSGNCYVTIDNNGVLGHSQNNAYTLLQAVAQPSGGATAATALAATNTIGDGIQYDNDKFSVKAKGNGGIVVDSDGVSIGGLTSSKWVKTDNEGGITTTDEKPAILPTGTTGVMWTGGDGANEVYPFLKGSTGNTGTSTTDIKPVGSHAAGAYNGSYGTTDYYARRDHVHPIYNDTGTKTNVESGTKKESLPTGSSITERINANYAGTWTRGTNNNGIMLTVCVGFFTDTYSGNSVPVYRTLTFDRCGMLMTVAAGTTSNTPVQYTGD